MLMLHWRKLMLRNGLYRHPGCTLNIYDLMMVFSLSLAITSILSRAEATPTSSILSSSTLRSSSSNKAFKSDTPLSVLLTDRYGLTPWGQALIMSDRYVTSLRTKTLKHPSLNHDRIQTSNQTRDILNSFDRYVLKRANLKSQMVKNPLYESKMSLSHNWRKGASGYLLNAHQMKKSSLWVNRRFKNYGTAEMIATIKAGVQELKRRFPNAPRLIIGDLAKRYGGHFPPHLSHQSGRDADIGYFIRGNYAYRLKGLTKVSPRTIDVPKTWAFLSGMLKTGLIESAFIDYHLQKSLYGYAKSDPDWTQEELDQIFSYPVWKGSIISHLRGHSDHMHVRFKAPLSTSAAHAFMSKNGRQKLKPRRVYTRPKKGENLIKLGRRFRVSWKTLRKWNHLTTTQARRTLRRSRKYIVGYYTPYFARHIRFPSINIDDKSILKNGLSHNL